MNKFNKTLLVALLLALVPSAYSEVKLSFTENSNIEFNISRSQYNRLLVKGDVIESLRYPAHHLAIEYVKDGSVYVDALDDRAFTLFIATKSGRHFSATVQVKALGGQTVQFEPKVIARKHLVKRPSRKAQLVNLMRATSNEHKVAGYKADNHPGKSIRLQPKINLHQVYSLSNSSLVAQKYVLKNVGNTPIKINKNWLKDSQTKAMLLSESTIYPHQEISVVRVEGVRHG